MKVLFKDQQPDKGVIAEKVTIYLMVGLALLGMLAPLVLGKYNWSLLGSYLGIPMIMAPVVWTRVKRNKAKIFVIKLDVHYLSAIVFFGCYALSILVLDHYAVRNLGYYLLVAVMGTCILNQILFSGNISKTQCLAILTETGLLMLNIIWGVTLKYHFFIGRTDMLHHSWLTSNLIETGHIGSVFDVYKAFPLWHILCTSIRKICGITWTPHRVMFLVNGLVYYFLIILVYLTVFKLLNNHQIALLSALFTCISSDVIFYGMYSIPRSVVFFLEILLIYFLLEARTPVSVALTLFFSLAIVMYHTASIPFVLVILMAIYSLQRMFGIEKEKYFVNSNYLLLLVVLTLTYWFYFGEKVFRAFVAGLLKPAPIGTMTTSIINTPLNELFNYLQYSPLLFFVICGVLWVVPSRNSDLQGKLFFVSALGLTFVTLPGPTLLINKLAENFNLNRFGEYSFFFICLAAATGLYALYLKSARKHRPALILLFSLMVFLSVSSDFSASDNPLVKRPFYTFYFTENEVTAMDRVAEFTKGYLMADAPAQKYLECSVFEKKAHILEVTEGSIPQFLANSSEDLLLIRKAELQKRPLKLFVAANGEFDFDPNLKGSQDYFFRESSLWNNMTDFNRVYDSGSVTALGFQKGGVDNETNQEF